MHKHWIGLVVVVGLAGCNGGHSLSGAYVAKDKQSTALLQLTQNKSQQLMGSLTIVVLKADASIERDELSITGGTTDGTSLTLEVKPNELAGQTQNFSGNVLSGAIDLTMGSSTQHFVPASVQDFESAAHILTVEGQTHQKLMAQAKRYAAITQEVAQLSADLDAYSAYVESGTVGPAQIRETEQKILTAAGNDLKLMHQLDANHQDFSASQVRFRIRQRAFQMGQVKFQIDQLLQQGQDHLKGFDERLAANPCSSAQPFDGCDALTSAKLRYGGTQVRVLNDLAVLKDDLEHAEAEMARINKEAGN